MYALEASLYAAAAQTYRLQLQPIRAVLCLLRQAYPVARLGPGPEEVQLRTGLAFAERLAGFARAADRQTDRASEIAITSGDPALRAYVALLDAMGRHSSGVDQGATLRQVHADEGRWLDLGAPSVEFDVARVEALALRDLGLTDEAAQRAERARALADRQGWAHHIRRIEAEFAS